MFGIQASAQGKAGIQLPQCSCNMNSFNVVILIIQITRLFLIIFKQTLLSF